MPRPAVRHRSSSVMAQNDALLDSFSGTKRARGFLTIRAALMQQCLIGITKLAYYTGPQNPTASQMVEVLLDPNAEPLREALRAEFAVPIKPASPIGETWSPEDEKMWEQDKQRETMELREAFDDQLRRIGKQWRWFDTHRRKFEDLRDRRLAHLDTSRIGKKYDLRKVSGPTWGVIKAAVQRLTEMAELLLNILDRKDESFGQFFKLAKRDATDFWKIKPTK